MLFRYLKPHVVTIHDFSARAAIAGSTGFGGFYVITRGSRVRGWGSRRGQAIWSHNTQLHHGVSHALTLRFAAFCTILFLRSDNASQEHGEAEHALNGTLHTLRGNRREPSPERYGNTGQVHSTLMVDRGTGRSSL